MIILMSLLVLACGYTFKSGGGQINPQIRKVYVAPFKNETSEPYLENYFRDAMISEFIDGKRFEIVSSPDESDAIFQGSIRKLIASPLSYNVNALAAEESVTATVRFSFMERVSGKTVWRVDNYSLGEDYFLSPGETQSTAEMNRKNALLKLSNELAERIYRLLTTDF
ncbi:MAG: LptE family protein [Syntrophales bacterium]